MIPMTAAQLPSRTVIAPDGCAIHVRTLQQGEGTPVLLVHALAMDGSLWRGVAESMTGNRPVYAMDCRGHGLSGRSPGSYSTKQFALDMVAVLDNLGAPAAHIVGCSMGGTVALAFVGQHPHRSASVTVIDATACYGEDVEQEWEARGMRPTLHGFASMVDFQLSRWFSDAFVAERPAVLEEAIDVFLRNDPKVYLESCRMLGHADERSALSEYTGPALVLVGSDDYATPLNMATDIAQRLSGSSLHILDGLRHFTPIEAPQAVAAALESLIARAETTESPTPRLA